MPGTETVICNCAPQIEVLEARLEELERKLSPRPRGDLSVILPAIKGEFGSTEFKVRELYTRPALRKLLEGISAKSAGKLLRSAIGKNIDNLTVENLTSERSTVVWRVMKVLL